MQSVNHELIFIHGNVTHFLVFLKQTGNSQNQFFISLAGMLLFSVLFPLSKNSSSGRGVFVGLTKIRHTCQMLWI